MELVIVLTFRPARKIIFWDKFCKKRGQYTYTWMARDQALAVTEVPAVENRTHDVVMEGGGKAHHTYIE